MIPTHRIYSTCRCTDADGTPVDICTFVHVILRSSFINLRRGKCTRNRTNYNGFWWQRREFHAVAAKQCGSMHLCLYRINFWNFEFGKLLMNRHIWTSFAFRCINIVVVECAILCVAKHERCSVRVGCNAAKYIQSATFACVTVESAHTHEHAHISLVHLNSILLLSLASITFQLCYPNKRFYWYFFSSFFRAS